MKDFAILFSELDQTNSTNEKVHIMARFFREKDPETCAWALYFLSGQKPKRLIGSGKLRAWAQEITGYPDWLMDDCYGAVGDTAEMIALILASFRDSQKNSLPEKSPDVSLGDWMTTRLLPLAQAGEDEQKNAVTTWWRELGRAETFLLNKFLTGGLRVGVSETLVYRALTEVLSLPRATIASRLLSRWTPSADFFQRLSLPPSDKETNSTGEIQALPKPFCLAAPLEGDPRDLGDIREWQLEWKWDGIRCQIVKVGARVEIWSRGEERVTDSFPDLAKQMSRVPGDWIFDGEMVAGSWHTPLLFNDLQKRLNKKKPSAAFQKENPVAFIAYDLLHESSPEGSTNWAEKPLRERRVRLETLLAPFVADDLGPSENLKVSTWDEAEKIRLTSRERGAEGLMVKNLKALYEVGRRRGIWFKWKVDPFTADVVLTAAQPGSGRRASLYTDYTFSIWRGDTLVPFAKAYSGLTDEEIRSLDHWIRRHTLDRFGPVRSLKPERVFELAFEGIAESTRNKSGLAVRFPRILRERTDKKAIDADRVETMWDLLKSLRGEPKKSAPAENIEFSAQMAFP